MRRCPLTSTCRQTDIALPSRGRYRGTLTLVSGTEGETSGARQRTLLQALAQRRHLTREQVIELLSQRARSMDVRDFSLSLRQLDRWFAGELVTQPRPSVCRVIEAEFGHPVEFLLGPEDGLGIHDHERASLGERNRQLRTVHFVSWLADNSEADFRQIYEAVATMADKLAGMPAAVRASAAHSRATLSRARIAEAVREYYGNPGSGFYTAIIAKDLVVSLSVWTQSPWIGLNLPLDAAHQAFGLSRHRDTAVAITPAVLQAAVNRLADVEVAETVMLDNPLYRLLDVDIDERHIGGTFGIARFATYAMTADLMEIELVDSLLAERPPHPGLPIRDLYLPSIHSGMDFDSRICAGGPACLLAIARTDDYLVVVQERSERVINVAGRLAVIPKAFHQPLGEAKETALSTTIERELEEELFGREEVDQVSMKSSQLAAPGHPSTMSEPMRWLLDHHNSYELSCTSFGINMLSGNYELGCLAIVDDPSWWEKFGGRVQANWETMRLSCYSSRDREGLTQLISDPRWSNEGLFAFLEGLRALAKRHKSKVEVPEIEMSA